MVGEEPGGQPLLSAAVRFVTHDGDAKVHLSGMRLERGGNGVKPRHHRRELGQKGSRRLETRFVKFFQDIHVVAGVNVFAERVAVIDEFHQPVPLFALWNRVRPGRP